LARRADGIHLAPFEQGEIGPDLFKAACDMMLEGLVSKRRDSRYRAGPSRDWIKVKNPASSAMNRAKDAFGWRCSIQHHNCSDYCDGQDTCEQDNPKQRVFEDIEAVVHGDDLFNLEV
jgi:hypothetical protein